MKELYDLVFDEQDNIKPCGREITIKLIEALSKLHPDEDFGNSKTGFMNLENVMKYKRGSV